MSTDRPSQLQPLPLSRAVDEFCLTAVILFLIVTIVRWLRYPTSPLYVSSVHAALYIIGPVFGVILIGLILSPQGRRSGGHMNPCVTIALWLMDVFPGKSVLPYVLAQLAGSVAGAALGRAAWGSAVANPAVNYGTVRASPSWSAADVFLAETACVIGLVLIIGNFLAYPRWSAWLPYAAGLYLALTISFLGPYSGGSINPARQFGPALLALDSTYLWIYLVTPVLGAALGAGLHHLLVRRFRTHEPLTYKLSG
jgi:glycerol uptake facilitator-like aquaporin